MLVDGMLVSWAQPRSSVVEKLLPCRCNAFDGMSSGWQFYWQVSFPFELDGMGNGIPDESCHQSIDAYFSILENVRFAKKDLQHARYGAIMINQQH